MTAVALPASNHWSSFSSWLLSLWWSLLRLLLLVAPCWSQPRMDATALSSSLSSRIAVNEHSAAFQKILHGLEHFSQHAVGGSMAQSSLRGRGLIISHVMKQAFVSAVNDDFLIAGGITILCLVPIFFLRKKRFHSGAKAAAVEL